MGATSRSTTGRKDGLMPASGRVETLAATRPYQRGHNRQAGIPSKHGWVTTGRANTSHIPPDKGVHEEEGKPPHGRQATGASPVSRKGPPENPLVQRGQMQQPLYERLSEITATQEPELKELWE